MISADEAVRRLDAIGHDDDPEMAHADADHVLRQAVPAEVAAAYDRVVRRQEDWWYA